MSWMNRLFHCRTNRLVGHSIDIDTAMQCFVSCWPQRWWTGSLVASSADCLAKFAVTADLEYGRVPTDPSALSRWEINRGNTVPRRAHNSDLRLVISENRRRNAASTGAVARLAAKYKPQTSETKATLARREQRRKLNLPIMFNMDIAL